MKRIITLGILILLPFTIFGQFRTYVPTSTTIVIIKIMYVDDMQYPFTIKGMRMYLTDIQANNPLIYEALNTTLKDLEDRQAKSDVTEWGSVIVGGVVFAIGSYLMFSNTSYEDESSGDNMMLGIGVTTAGVAIALGGFFIGQTMAPKEEDFYLFVNQHNRLNPDHIITVR